MSVSVFACLKMHACVHTHAHMHTRLQAMHGVFVQTQTSDLLGASFSVMFLCEQGEDEGGEGDGVDGPDRPAFPVLEDLGQRVDGDHRGSSNTHFAR